MSCEYSEKCGFHQYLVKQEIISPEDSCGKIDESECPRYRQAEGRLSDHQLKQAAKIFGTSDLYNSDLPISNEEVQIATRGIIDQD